MNNLKVEKNDPFSTISQEIKDIPLIKEYIENYTNDNSIGFPEDILICVALGMDFWDLDTLSQNKLIKEMIVRLLKLESGL